MKTIIRQLMVRFGLVVVFLVPIVSWGQEFDLKNLVNKIPFVNDSLERIEESGHFTNMVYNDSIEVKIVQCQLDGVSYFKMVGNWNTEKYDKNSIFINVKNYILVLPINDSKYYAGVFTFDIVSPTFIPSHRITIDHYRIKLITYYRSINMCFYKLENYYVSAVYSMSNCFYFEKSKLYEAINKREIYSLESSVIEKTVYVKQFLNFR